MLSLGYAPMSNRYTPKEPGIRGFQRGQVFPWPLEQMSELVTLNYGKALPESTRMPGSIPVFGSNGVTGSHSASLASGPTVILGRKGQGPLGVEWCDGPFWVIDTAYYVTFNDDRLDPRFFYYFVDYVGLNHLKDGTSNPSLTRATFGVQQIPVPPKATQRRIATVLSALDDKIELNRQMNYTLENMARALFESWFVNFEVHADLVDSALGLIPCEWSVGSLLELALLNPEGWTHSTRPNLIQYVDLSNTKWGRIESVTEYGRDDAPSRAQRVLRRGDTIVGTVRPGNGSYALVAEEGLTGSTGFAVLRPRAPENRAYVYFAATRRENIDRLAHLADGGAYPAVRPDLVAQTPVALPPQEWLRRYETAVDPMLQRIELNLQQSRTLTALRDLLLPRLISGKLRVSEAEEAIAEAMV